LQPGARLEVALTGAELAGRPLVRADIGQFAVDAAQPLDRSIRYLLEIITTGTSIQAAIVAKNGVTVTAEQELRLLPVPGSATTAPATYRPAPGVQFLNPAPGNESRPATFPAPAIEPGNQLTAHLVTRQNEPGAAPSPIAAGSSLVVRVLGLAPPLSTTIPVTAPRTGPRAAAAPSAGEAAAPPPRGTPAPAAQRNAVPLQRAFEVAQLFHGGPITPPEGISLPAAGAGATVPLPANPRATAATVATGIKGSPIAAGRPGAAAGSAGSIITGIAVTSAQDAASRGNISETGAAAGPGGSSQLLRTPMGLLRLDTADTLATGTTVALEVVAVRGPLEPQALAPLPPLLNLATTWPVLDDIMETLAATNPVLAAQTAHRALPAPTTRLGPALLFFMAALNLGDARTWLGQAATAALETAGRQDLLRRLGTDFSRIRRAAEEPPARDPGSGDWRPTVFPFLDAGAIRPLTLFTRHGQNQGDDEDNSSETRFVLEVDLSALGPVQLDGLVRKNNFDLMVRSKNAFTEQMRDDIRQLFRNAVEPTGLEGSVRFQATSRFPVSPKDEYLRAQGHAADSVVV
jgi:hypothetical protein